MNFSYIIMVVFGFFILMSWTGYGILVNRILFPQKSQEFWLCTGWGLSFTLFIGGILNILAIISPFAIYLFIVVGFLILSYNLYLDKREIWQRFKNNIQRVSRNKLFLLLTIVYVTFLFLIYLGSVSNIHFNWGEDMHGYFVFPKKMLQTGSLGLDPFSEQRILMLGGMSFLHSLVLSLGDFRNLNFIDVGLGTILTAGLLFGFARELGLSKWKILLVAFIMLIIVPSKANISSLIIGLALFITLFRTLFLFQGKGSKIIPVSIVLSLIIGALISLKTNYLITSTIFIFFSYLFYFYFDKPNRRKIIMEIIYIGLFTFAFLLPWFVANHQSNGTMLYPILGKGFHDADWLQLNSNTPIVGLLSGFKSVLLSFKIIPLLLFFSGFLIFSNRETTSKKYNVIALFISIIISLIAILILSKGHGWTRYSWSAVTSIGLILLILVLGIQNLKSAIHQSVRWSIVLAGVIIIVLQNAPELTDHYKNKVNAIVTGWNNENIMVGHINYSLGDEITERYLTAQKSIPKDEVIFERTQYPFLFNFARNDIYITHFLGASSLPPGMPFYKGGEALAKYFLNQSIRYIVYSYKTEANFKYEDYKGWGTGRKDPWITSSTLHTFNFHDNLSEIRKMIEPIYDDGDIFVLDLELYRPKLYNE